MPQPPSQLTNVLKYWHKIEFFSPYDLDNALSASPYKFGITHEELHDENCTQFIPWLSQKALEDRIGKTDQKYQYAIYFLPFEKNELTRLCQKLFGEENNPIRQMDYEERLDDEGLSCFAKLVLSPEGTFNLNNLSISTLPWALGKLKKNALDELSAHQYRLEEEAILFNEILKVFLRLQASTDRNDGEVQLTPKAILELTAVFQSWANFDPKHPQAIMVAMWESSASTKKTEEKNNEFVSEDNAEEDDENNIPILNSFYIEDLEKIIIALDKSPCDILKQYVTGDDIGEKIDLREEKNETLIKEALTPKKMSEGRWPQPSHFSMSLMQQFAINTSFNMKGNQALFSINGPPGTGKTTLIQEIIANNVVQRAKSLSQFESVISTFKETKSISLGGKTHNVQELDPTLTGYEMLVVSSNNTAVENITKDFPIKNNLADEFKSDFGYLTPVARLCAAKLGKGKEISAPLKKNAEPWGLISAALGRRKNCQLFADRVFFHQEAKGDLRKKRVNEKMYLTLWEWAKSSATPSFKQAKQKFISINKQFEDYINQIERLRKLIAAEALSQKRENTLKERIANLRTDIHSMEKSILSTKKDLKEKEDALQKCQNDRKVLIKNKPSFLARAFRAPEGKLYRHSLDAIFVRINAALTNKTQSDERLFELKKQKELLLLKQEELLDKIAQAHQKTAKASKDCRLLLKILEGIMLPTDEKLDGNEKAQLNAFWQNKKLNQLRTQLFSAALTLHEAWLREAIIGRHGLFRENCFAISQFLHKGCSLKDTESARLVWQSIFMLVPVISSTFASTQRLLKNLGQGVIGWLLIDEAGQAVPQAAVGAIWRSKKAIVVGDPRQIKPIYTTPPRLVETFAQQMLNRPRDKWLPTQTSVQELADAANPLGIYVQLKAKSHWLGCPLTIHRRCIDPMFSVANEIAYEGRMFNARVKTASSNNQYPLGPSRWIDMVAPAADKQYVPAQGDLLVHLLSRLISHHQTLPSLYVITPFKQIKLHLQKKIISALKEATTFPNIEKCTAYDVRQWCYKHIGTVHAFQGKQSDVVIFVLGADRNMPGSVRWASSEPNLLNVAITRAKDRVYIIGDHALWAGQHYFNCLSMRLDKTPSHYFLEDATLNDSPATQEEFI
ncbi:MAG: DEAD/DEAH box helicase [Gammaproteobacteria bacterium]